MKNLVFFPLLLITFNVFSQNIPRKSPQERAEVFVQSLTSSLSLADEQVNKIKTIQIERFLKLDELRTKAKASGDPKLVRDEMKKLNEASELHIKSVLTPEQSSKYDAWLDKIKVEMKNRKGNGG